MAAARGRNRWASWCLVLVGLWASAAGDFGNESNETNETNETNATNATNVSETTFTTTTGIVTAVGSGAVASSEEVTQTLPPPRQEGTWESFGFEVGICAATWASLLFVSLLLGTCRAGWEADRVEHVLRSFVVFLTRNRIYLAICGVLSLGMCLLHVMKAEFESTDLILPLDTWHTLELAVQFPHLLEVLLIWVHATARSMSDTLRFAFGRLIVDILIIVSTLLCHFGVRKDLSFSFAASMRVLILWQQYLHSRPGRRGIKLLVVHGVMRLACAIFFAGCLIRQVENIRGPELPPVDLRDIWTLEASLYFVMTSLLTVGYGDLSPQTYFGQLFAACIVVSGLWLLCRTSIGVMQAVDSSRAGSGRYDKKRVRHIVVTGSPSFQVLQDFLLELYNEDLGHLCEELNVVLLLLPGQRHVVDQMRNFLRELRCSRFHHCIWMVQGSALRQEDLKRVNYRDAVMAFLLPNLYTQDVEREDIDNAMRALSMRRYVPFVRVIGLLLRAEHRDVMLSVGMTPGDIVCVDELKQGMMAKSCEAQGFTPLTCGLFKRAGGVLMETDIREARQNWVQEFVKGMSNEIFEVPLSPSYAGAPFGEVAVDILLRSEGKAYLVGVVEDPSYPGDDTITSIFPGKHYKVGTREDRKCVGIFVGKSVADIVQYPPGSKFPWHIDPDMRAQLEEKGVPNLPGTVQELVASEKTEGWVKEPRDIKADLALSLMKGSQITAAQWATQGIRQQTKLDRGTIQELIGLESADYLKDSGNDGGPGLSAEDDPEYATDPTQKALLEAQFAEEEQVAAASEAAAEEKVMYAARRVVAVAEQIEDRRRALLDLSERDKEEDAVLWGYPQRQPPKSFGSEPRPAQLVRGEHVLVMAIEPPSAEGPTNVDGVGSGDPSQRLGTKLGIHNFVRSLRAGASRHHRRPRVVVVVAESTPRDWAKAAAEGDVYLVLGNPNSANTLKRAGLTQAHAVVVHQRSASTDRDPYTVDAEAVFACRLAEKMLADAGLETPVICDLHLSHGAGFLPFGLPYDDLRDAAGKDDEEETFHKPLHAKISPLCVQSRFLSGHIFSSSLATALVANMFYKPSLGYVVHEMLHKQVTVIPVPEEFKGRTFGQLFEHVLRKNNLLPMGLLRLRSVSQEDLEEDDMQHQQLYLGGDEDTPVPQLAIFAPEAPDRWQTGEPTSERFLKIMPPGDALVADHDGVLCAVATNGRVVFPPVTKAVLVDEYGTRKRRRRRNRT